MKVMCIYSTWSTYDFNDMNNSDQSDPKYGEIVTVIGEDKIWGIEVYKIAEYGPYPYSKNGFIPLSEIDETELVNKEPIYEH